MGGVVGGVVLVAAAILFFVLRRRRLRRKWAAEQKARSGQSSTDAGSGSPTSSPDSTTLYDKQMLDSNQVHELPPQGNQHEMGSDGALSEAPGGVPTAYYYQLDDGTIMVEMPHSKDVPVEMPHNQDLQPQELSAEPPQRREAEAGGFRDPRGETGVGNGTGVPR